jgi:hypothetical protein
LTPIGFFNYGGLIAMQTLWAGPWMAKVAGYSSLEAAGGLFWINVSMLFTFLMWGLITPKLYLLGLNTNRLITAITPLNLLVQCWIVWSGPDAGALHWALFCISGSVVSLAQPAVGAAFPATEAGKGLSGYNLVLFLGVFCVQWGFGLLVDMFRNFGLEEVASFPSGEHDDLVDSMTQALLRYRRGGFIQLASDEEDEPRQFRRKEPYY